MRKITTEAGLGQEISLFIGQAAVIASEDLKVKFIDVISDSRCPRGAICVWEGEASCLIEITNEGYIFRKVLTQPGLSGPAKTSLIGYKIAFDLHPYPETGRTTNKQDYHLGLVISQGTGALW